MEQCKVNNKEVWVVNLDDVYDIIRDCMGDDFAYIVNKMTKNKVDVLTEENEYLEEELSQTQDSLEDAEDEINSLECQIRDLEDELTVKDNEIEDLSIEIDRLTNEH